MPIADARAQEVLASLSRAGLAPGTTPLFPAGFAPATELRVSFGSRALDLGTSFVKSECTEAPRIAFSPECYVGDVARQVTDCGRGTQADRPEATYTLLLVDPDAPYPHDTRFANWRHWVVAGLRPGGATVEDAVLTREALTPYLAPGPKDDSPPHRYLFQLFREPEGGGLAHLTKADVGGDEFVERRSFDSPAWAARYGLELVAVNWMSCASDAWEAK